MFISTDITGPLSTNMYAYCENNPVNASDPTGEFFNTIFGGITGAIIGGINAYKNGDNVFAGVLIGGATGAVAGLVTDIAVSTGGIGAFVISAAVSGIANSANTLISNKINGKSTSASDLVCDFVSGTIGGMLSFGVSGGSLQKVASPSLRRVAEDFTKTLLEGTTKRVGTKIVSKCASYVTKRKALNIAYQAACTSTISSGMFIFGEELKYVA